MEAEAMNLPDLFYCQKHQNDHVNRRKLWRMFSRNNGNGNMVIKILSAVKGVINHQILKEKLCDKIMEQFDSVAQSNG